MKRTKIIRKNRECLKSEFETDITTRIVPVKIQSSKIIWMKDFKKEISDGIGRYHKHAIYT